MNFSLGVQRELPRGFFVEANYVGNLGRHLIRQPDLNQPSFAALTANLPVNGGANVNTNALRPYKGFTNILYEARMRTRATTVCSSMQPSAKVTSS